MICPICKSGEMQKGFTTTLFENNKSIIIIKKVPAEICENCSEQLISEKVSRHLLEIVYQENKKGIEIEIIQYAA